MRDLPVRRVGDLRRGEERGRLSPGQTGQESREPAGELRGRQDTRHQLGLGQRRGQEVVPGRLVLAGVAGVATEPAQDLGRDRVQQLRLAGRGQVPRPRQRPGQPERAVAVHAVPDRVGRRIEPVQEPAGEHRGQRRQRVRPAPRVSVVPARQLISKSQRPAPAVGPLPVGARASRPLRFGRQPVRRELPVQRGPHLRHRNRVRDHPQQSDQQPVHLHARVPVQAAEEDRVLVPHPRRRILRPVLQVDHDHRELAPDVGQRDLGVPGRRPGQDLAPGAALRHPGHRSTLVPGSSRAYSAPSGCAIRSRFAISPSPRSFSSPS